MSIERIGVDNKTVDESRCSKPARAQGDLSGTLEEFRRVRRPGFDSLQQATIKELLRRNGHVGHADIKCDLARDTRMSSFSTGQQ